jgi:hypothetical protein
MTTEVERVDVRLDMALSLLEVQKREKAPVMPAVFASAGLAAASLFLAAMVIFGAGGGHTPTTTTVIRATEAPAVQSSDTGNATFELSASRDGLKGNVATNQGAVAAGSEGAR